LAGWAALERTAALLTSGGGAVAQAGGQGTDAEAHRLAGYDMVLGCRTVTSSGRAPADACARHRSDSSRAVNLFDMHEKYAD
jgi:hypothetical protein